MDQTDENVEEPTSKFSLNKFLVILFATLTTLAVVGVFTSSTGGDEDRNNLEKDSDNEIFVSHPEDPHTPRNVVSRVKQTFYGTKTAVKRLYQSRRKPIIIGVVTGVLLAVLTASAVFASQYIQNSQEPIPNPEEPPVIPEPPSPTPSPPHPLPKTDEEILEESKFTASLLRAAFAYISVVPFVMVILCWKFGWTPWTNDCPYDPDYTLGVREYLDCYKTLVILFLSLIAVSYGVAVTVSSSEETHDVLMSLWRVALLPALLYACKIVSVISIVGASCFLLGSIGVMFLNQCLGKSVVTARRFLASSMITLLVAVGSRIASRYDPLAITGGPISFVALVVMCKILEIQIRKPL